MVHVQAYYRLFFGVPHKIYDLDRRPPYIGLWINYMHDVRMQLERNLINCMMARAANKWSHLLHWLGWVLKLTRWPN